MAIEHPRHVRLAATAANDVSEVEYPGP